VVMEDPIPDGKCRHPVVRQEGNRDYPVPH
jgi:hypothetical protein